MHRKQSQIVNNFFTLASIIIIAVTIVLYSEYVVEDPNEIKKEQKIKIEPLLCEEDSPTKYKVYNQKLLNSSMKALNNGFYKLQGGYIKALYSNSIVEDFISLEELDKAYIKAIGLEAKKDISKFLTIKYELIENDKKDPKKKKDKCKLCSGTIVTSFRANAVEIFSISTQFHIFHKEEIEDRIACSIKVYKNHGR